MSVEAYDQPYTRHFATLIALITHLSNTPYKSRSPLFIANALGLARDEVQEVLDKFPGFFRKPRNLNPSSGEHYYTVHLRFARRSLDGNREIDSRPLEPEELSALFNLASQMVAQESAMSRLYIEIKKENQNTRRTILITLLVGIVSAIAAIIAAIIAARR